jgi:hypothetical protein
MKNLPRRLKAVFFSVFVLQMMCLIFLSAVPEQGRAADPKFTPQVGIPGSEEFGPGIEYTFSTKSTRPIGLYIRAIYKYAIGIVGILATVVLMVGGIVWLTAGGNPTRIGEAKAYIGASLTGLILTLSSYLILATINPALINLKESSITQVGQAGCCYAWSDASGTKTKCLEKQQSECTDQFTPGKTCSENYYCSNCDSEGNCSPRACKTMGELCYEKTAINNKGFCNYNLECKPCLENGKYASDYFKSYECCSGLTNMLTKECIEASNVNTEEGFPSPAGGAG